jgi:hypothetical protein
MVLPNLIVIGVSKAGTSSLFDYLGRHPDVCQADIKEVRYFDPLRMGDVPLPPLAEYAAHFAHCDQEYAMEATPGYFYGGAVMAKTMKRLLEPRVVVSLREPISRCWSWYRFEKSRLRLPAQITFDDYLDRCFALHEEGTDILPENKPHWGVGGGCYDQWMDEWLDVYDEDEMKILFFDDLVEDSSAVTTDVLEWLGLDPAEADLSNLVPLNVTTPYRSKAAQQAAVKVNRRGERFFRRHAAAKRLLRKGYYAVNKNRSTAEVMSATARQRLQFFFQPHNAKLADQLTRAGLVLPASWSAP